MLAATLISTAPSAAYYTYYAFAGGNKENSPAMDVSNIAVLRCHVKKKKYFIVGIEDLKELKYKRVEEAYNAIVSAGYGRLKEEDETKWKEVLDGVDTYEKKAVMVFYKKEETKAEFEWWSWQGKAKDKEEEKETMPISSEKQENDPEKKSLFGLNRSKAVKKDASKIDDQQEKKETEKKEGFGLNRKKAEDKNTETTNDPKVNVKKANKKLGRRGDDKPVVSSGATKTKRSPWRSSVKDRKEEPVIDVEKEPTQREKTDETLGSFWGFSQANPTEPNSPSSQTETKSATGLQKSEKDEHEKQKSKVAKDSKKTRSPPSVAGSTSSWGRRSTEKKQRSTVSSWPFGQDTNTNVTKKKTEKSKMAWCLTNSKKNQPSTTTGARPAFLEAEGTGKRGKEGGNTNAWSLDFLFP